MIGAKYKRVCAKGVLKKICCKKVGPTLNEMIQAAGTGVSTSRNRWIAFQRNQHVSHVCGWNVEKKTNTNLCCSGWNGEKYFLPTRITVKMVGTNVPQPTQFTFFVVRTKKNCPTRITLKGVKRK